MPLKGDREMGRDSAEEFVELVETFEKDDRMSRWDLNRMILDSIREILGMVYSREIAKFIEGTLDLDALEDEEDFDPAHFVKKLKMVFGKDERHIRMMVTGRMLTKYHHHEFMENIGSPITG